ncbi:hypothetical protein [Caballeronia sp. SBC2]|uniref:hypothetical protein n=1 Tax=Caballeronia sp. SBC2 TaxID=2705547 RepID=UPI0013E1D0F4|nr:hypothetical protein [Caballeronia sp. SBC2]QIE22912.1 hypothetical protein SBC2_09250 [Caballeronia sp. SBC2]
MSLIFFKQNSFSHKVFRRHTGNMGLAVYNQLRPQEDKLERQVLGTEYCSIGA